MLPQKDIMPDIHHVRHNLVFFSTVRISLHIVASLWAGHKLTDMSLSLTCVALYYMLKLAYDQSSFKATTVENSFETTISVLENYLPLLDSNY